VGELNEGSSRTIANESWGIDNLQIATGPDACPRPDIVVTTVDASGLTGDWQSLQVSGMVSAQIANVGNGPVSIPFEVSFFEDRNFDGTFNAVADNVLGSATVNSLAAGASTTVSAAIDGTVLFRDNLIYAFVDSASAVNESDESNNLAESGRTCVSDATQGTEESFRNCDDGDDGVLAQSGFDAGDEGWLLVSEGCTSPPCFGPAPANFSESGGNPGGHVWRRDPDNGGEYWIAPPSFLGNKSAAFGGSLQLDMYDRGPGDHGVAPTVWLRGGDAQVVELRFDGTDTAYDNWKTYAIGLTEIGWTNTTTNDPASRLEMVAVLSSLERVRITATYVFGLDETFGLDNVVLSAGPCPEKLADVSASFITISCDDFFRVATVRVGNGGAATAPAGVPVSFYDGDPATGARLLGTFQTLFPMPPGLFEDVSVTLHSDFTCDSVLYSAVDDDGASVCVDCLEQFEYAVVQKPAGISFAADGTLYTGRTAFGAGGGDLDPIRIHQIGVGGTPVRVRDCCRT
jgi:hypothetical protein